MEHFQKEPFSKALADRQANVYNESIELIAFDLRKRNNSLFAIQMFYYDYNQIHGTTTECENILGPMGILPPRKYPC